MSAGRSAGGSMDKKDDDDEYGKPIVQVEGIERGREEEDTSNIRHVGKKEREPKGYVHEGETIKTTVIVEDDSPSLYQKLRGKFIAAEEHFRSMDVLHTKKADPHAEVNFSVSSVQATNKPHVTAGMEKNVRGDKHHDNKPKDEVKGKKDPKDEVKSKKDPKDETSRPHPLEKFSSTKETFDPETTEDRKVQAGDELGTGYEESSEDGGVSPGSGVTSCSGPLPKQSESLFKPVKQKDCF